MKKTKPKKDELLNQILEEISDENNEINNGYRERESQDYNKKISSNRKNIQSIIITMFIVIILFVFFYPNHKTNKVDHNDTRKETSSIPKANQLHKEQKDTELKTEKEEKLDTEVQGKKTVETTATKEENTSVKEEKVLTPQNPKTEREKAKEILMKQMQN